LTHVNVSLHFDFHPNAHAQPVYQAESGTRHRKRRGLVEAGTIGNVSGSTHSRTATNAGRRDFRRCIYELGNWLDILWEMASVKVQGGLVHRREMHQMGRDGGHRAGASDARSVEGYERTPPPQVGQHGRDRSACGGKSYNAQENAILQQILCLYHEHAIWFTITYIPSKENPVDPML
jgi:hypothetical protein